jgi:glyoxylase-like metal-dependent hydrolase (beta-lactamase superfamily II)
MKKLALALLTMAAAGALLAQGQQDFSKVEIKTNKLSANFYTLDGQGGTIGVLTGPDGVFQVDSQFAPLSTKIATAVKAVAPKTAPWYMVNTHVHGDHTGGDENFGKMGVTIMSRPELRERLAHPAPGANGQPGTPMPAAGLPVITYNNQIAFHMDGEDVQLIPIPRAHTDGDTMVYFVHNDILMTGDFYRSMGYPNIDIANGGSMNGMLDGLARIVALVGPKTRIVPGHGDIVDRSAVQFHRDMMMAVRDKVSAMVDQGKTQQEVVAAKPTAEFDPKVPGGAGMTADRFVGQLYAQLKAAK